MKGRLVIITSGPGEAGWARSCAKWPGALTTAWTRAEISAVAKLPDVELVVFAAGAEDCDDPTRLAVSAEIVTFSCPELLLLRGDSPVLRRWAKRKKIAIVEEADCGSLPRVMTEILVKSGVSARGIGGVVEMPDRKGASRVFKELFEMIENSKSRSNGSSRLEATESCHFPSHLYEELNQLSESRIRASFVSNLNSARSDVVPPPANIVPSRFDSLVLSKGELEPVLVERDFLGESISFIMPRQERNLCICWVNGKRLELREGETLSGLLARISSAQGRTIPQSRRKIIEEQLIDQLKRKISQLELKVRMKKSRQKPLTAIRAPQPETPGTYASLHAPSVQPPNPSPPVLAFSEVPRSQKSIQPIRSLPKKTHVESNLYQSSDYSSSSFDANEARIGKKKSIEISSDDEQKTSWEKQKKGQSQRDSDRWASSKPKTHSGPYIDDRSYSSFTKGSASNNDSKKRSKALEADERQYQSLVSEKLQPQSEPEVPEFKIVSHEIGRHESPTDAAFRLIAEKNLSYAVFDKLVEAVKQLQGRAS